MKPMLGQYVYLWVRTGAKLRGRLTIMIDRLVKLDMPEVPGALSHELLASTAFEVTIDRSKMRIIQTFFTRSLSLLILFVTSQPRLDVRCNEVK